MPAQTLIQLSFLSVCISTVTAKDGHLHAPPQSVMQFAVSMAMVTSLHLMIRGLTSMDNVNTHLYR